MKKVFFILLLVASLALSLTSCTEEVVKPRDGGDGGSISTGKGS